MTNSKSSNRKRKPRYEPVASEKQINIRNKELDILEAIHSYKLLSMSQVATLFFSSKKTASNRMRDFLDAELVQIKRMAVISGSAENLYFLSPLGAKWLSQGRGIEIERIRKIRSNVKNWKEDSPLLPHFIEVNDVRAALERACKLNNYRMVEWRYEQDFRVKGKGKGFQDMVRDPETSQRIPIAPDGFCVIELPGGRSSFFIEVVRATKGTNKIFFTRVRGYLAYYRTEGFQRRFNYKHFRVLGITPKKNLPKLLRGTASEMHKLGEQIPMFCLVAKENITPQDVFTSAIWEVPDSGGLKTLW